MQRKTYKFTQVSWNRFILPLEMQPVNDYLGTILDYLILPCKTVVPTDGNGKNLVKELLILLFKYKL